MHAICYSMRELLQSNVTFRSACVWADALVTTEAVLRTVHSNTARGRQVDCRECRYLKFIPNNFTVLNLERSSPNFVHTVYTVSVVACKTGAQQ
jgi:hypothetical protein